MHGIHSCQCCGRGILGAELGVETGTGWAHLHCLKETELEKLKRWHRALRACWVAVEAEGMWLRRMNAQTPGEALESRRRWEQRSKALDELLADRLGELTGN
ncbi:MAG TPA: hypothetical protein VHM70_01030 [Polyangiaceae bacterium]|jgi:hypothetical protein|nr:hypothetical protein [Polyangiaceae bacterium]